MSSITSWKDCLESSWGPHEIYSTHDLPMICAVVKRWIMLAAERFGSAGAAGLEHTMALAYDSAMMSKLFGAACLRRWLGQLVVD